jgi:hypothetical protein
METLPQAQLEQIAALVADRSLGGAELQARAEAIAGSASLARRALEWLPEAFGLVAVSHLEELNVPTKFSARRADGAWEHFRFSAEPLFAASVHLALAAAHQANSSFKAIAEQSSAIAAVDNALNAGQDLKGATLSGPALIGIPAETYSGAALSGPGNGA